MEGTPNPQAPPAATGSQPAGENQTAMDEKVEGQEAVEQITGLFYSGNPKHVSSGLAEAASNVGAGVSLGVAGLVGATREGYKEGYWGAAKGLGIGAAGLVGMSGYGVYTGAKQLGKGVYNTPEAVREAAKGDKVWDSSTQQWVQVNLQDDLRDLPVSDKDLHEEAVKLYEEEIERRQRLDAVNQGKEAGSKPAPAQGVPTGQTKGAEVPGAGAANRTSSPTPCAEKTAASPNQSSANAPLPGMNDKDEVTDYYLFLGVEKTATPTEVKKAFTRKALAMHPDKNPDDPNATQRFQQLLHVYNVLSNPSTRAQYDRDGTLNPSEVEVSDANPMEEVLGLKFLEPLTGRLRFALYFEPQTMYKEKMMIELHRRRRLRIAQNLCNYLDNAETGFESATFAIRDAVSTRCGPEFVGYIADSYHTASRQYLYGNSWKRELDSWYSSKTSAVEHAWNVVSTGILTAYRAARKTATEEDLIALLATASESDIKRTVLQACRLVLFDTSVPVETRQLRAQRLDKLSDITKEEVRKETESRAAAAAAEKQNQAPPGATGGASQS